MKFAMVILFILFFVVWGSLLITGEAPSKASLRKETRALLDELDEVRRSLHEIRNDSLDNRSGINNR